MKLPLQCKNYSEMYPQKNVKAISSIGILPLTPFHRALINIIRRKKSII